MSLYRNLFTLSVVTLTLIAMSTSVKADMAPPSEIYFNLTNAKDKSNGLPGLWHGFEFVISQTNVGDKTGALLTFKLTEEGVRDGYGTGKDSVKFDSFGIDLTNKSDVFKSDYAWSNGGWTGDDNGGTSIFLEFVNGMSWEKFVELAEYMVINAHVKSINGNGKDGSSLNRSEFTYYGPNEPGLLPPPPKEPTDPDNATPEPATMLIFGLGLTGLGIARRRMMK